MIKAEEFKNYAQDANGKWWYYAPGKGGHRQGCSIYQCEECGRDFPRATRSVGDPAYPKYCSKQCSVEGTAKVVDHPRGPKSPQWRGGRRKSYGYVQIYCPGHPRAGKKAYMMEHRLVMEEHLGRYLEKGEQVHHINGVRDDNRIENLELWKLSHPSGQRVHDKHCSTCTCGEVAHESVEMAASQVRSSPV